MKVDHTSLKTHVYESSRTRLRLDVEERATPKGVEYTWYWIQVEDRDRGRFLDHFLSNEEALHLACTIITHYAGTLSKSGDIDHLKAWAQAILEKLEKEKEGGNP
jgi:hypothetical protein